MTTMTLMMLYLVSTVNDYTQMTVSKVRQLLPTWNLGGFSIKLFMVKHLNVLILLSCNGHQHRSVCLWDYNKDVP